MESPVCVGYRHCSPAIDTAKIAQRVEFVPRIAYLYVPAWPVGT